MKKTIALIMIAFCSAQAIAQKLNEKDVPKTVVDAFAKKYPGSKVQKWEKEGANYEAEFDLSKVESSAVFDASGTFIELEQEIKIAELPKVAVEYCAKTFPEYKLEEAAKIVDAKGTITFEAEMRKGKEHFDVIFDDKGNFIKKGPVTK